MGYKWASRQTGLFGCASRSEMKSWVPRPTGYKFQRDDDPGQKMDPRPEGTIVRVGLLGFPNPEDLSQPVSLGSLRVESWHEILDFFGMKEDPKPFQTFQWGIWEKKDDTWTKTEELGQKNETIPNTRDTLVLELSPQTRRMANSILEHHIQNTEKKPDLLLDDLRKLRTLSVTLAFPRVCHIRHLGRCMERNEFLDNYTVRDPLTKAPMFSPFILDGQYVDIFTLLGMDPEVGENGTLQVRGAVATPVVLADLFLCADNAMAATYPPVSLRNRALLLRIKRYLEPNLREFLDAWVETEKKLEEIRTSRDVEQQRALLAEIVRRIVARPSNDPNVTNKVRFLTV